VLISAVVAKGLCHELVKKQIIFHELITSHILLDELAQKLKTKFDAKADDLPLFVAFREIAEIVEPAPLTPPVCRDRDDDWVLATALAGNANLIVTGDDDLLVLEKFRGVQILSPRTFLEMMDRR
jgi:putative PIN family toxin of toxin-antitoxin system